MVVGWHLPVGFEDNLFDTLAGGVWPAAACPKHVGSQPEEAAAFLNHVSWVPPAAMGRAGRRAGRAHCGLGWPHHHCAPACPRQALLVVGYNLDASPPYW